MILRRPIDLQPEVWISVRMAGWTHPRLLVVNTYPTPAHDPRWLLVAVRRAPVTDMRPEEHVPPSIRLHRNDMVEVCTL